MSNPILVEQKKMVAEKPSEKMNDKKYLSEAYPNKVLLVGRVLIVLK